MLDSIDGGSTVMRGKFRLDKIIKTDYAEEFEFNAVYGGTSNKEDNTYSEATPCGSIKMTVTNKALHGQFKPGQKFYLDFKIAAE